MDSTPLSERVSDMSLSPRARDRTGATIPSPASRQLRATPARSSSGAASSLKRKANQDGTARKK